ncbi:MAG TPA: hypothetical protein VGN88_09745 [Phycisphaerae bacterium]|jgi:hypothetical protein
MPDQFLQSHNYPKSHVLKIKALDGIIFVIGLAMGVGPFALRTLPGSPETTAHVTLGALIAVFSVFRVLVAYGSFWIEVPLFFLGLIILCLPLIFHMQWNAPYNTAHLAGGGIIMACALISAVITVPVINRLKAQGK